MTTKELLRELVDHLDEHDAEDALELLRRRYDADLRKRPARKLPSFVGTGRGGQADLGRQAKTILRKEWGQEGSAQ